MAFSTRASSAPVTALQKAMKDDSYREPLPGADTKTTVGMPAIKVDNPQKSETQDDQVIIKKVEPPVSDSENTIKETTEYLFEDNSIKIIWNTDFNSLTDWRGYFGGAEIIFVLTNKTNAKIKIIWDESVCRLPDGTSHPLAPSGTKLINATESKPSSIILKQGIFKRSIFIADGIKYNSMAQKWLYKSFLWDSDDDASNYIGKTFVIMLTIETENNKNEYEFTFLAKDIKTKEREKEPKNDSSGCFIATACAGINSYEVNVLRKFRDNHLDNSDIGRKFISFYYKYSPQIAGWLETKYLIKWLVKNIREVARGIDIDVDYHIAMEGRSLSKK